MTYHHSCLYTCQLNFDQVTWGREKEWGVSSGCSRGYGKKQNRGAVLLRATNHATELKRGDEQQPIPANAVLLRPGPAAQENHEYLWLIGKAGTASGVSAAVGNTSLALVSLFPLTSNSLRAPWRRDSVDWRTRCIGLGLSTWFLLNLLLNIYCF